MVTTKALEIRRVTINCHLVTVSLKPGGNKLLQVKINLRSHRKYNTMISKYTEFTRLTVKEMDKIQFNDELLRSVMASVPPEDFQRLVGSM